MGYDSPALLLVFTLLEIIALKTRTQSVIKDHHDYIDGRENYSSESPQTIETPLTHILQARLCTSPERVECVFM